MTLSLRLDYISAGFALFLGLIVLSELSILRGEHPCEWKEVVVVRESLLHIHQVHAQQILSRQGMYPGIVVHLLKQVHLDQRVSIDRNISPIHVPVTCLHIILHFPS